MSLADRIVIMHEGVLQQVGTPDEVYAHPQNLFVAQFVGSPVMNVSQATVTEGEGAVRVHYDPSDPGFEFPRELLGKLNGHRSGGLSLGIRPEGVLVSREAQPGYLPLEAHIIEPLGSHDIVDLKVGEGMLRARTPAGYVPRPGEVVHARIDPAPGAFLRYRHWQVTRSEALGHGPYRAQEHHQGLRRQGGAEEPGPRDRGRAVLRPAGRDGGRQDDHAAHRGRAGEADRRQRAHRRCRCRRLGSGRARRGAGLAAIFALSALHRAREPRVPAEVQDPPGRSQRDRHARRARRQDPAHPASSRPQDRPALGRRDAARLDRARDRAQAARLPDGRAPVGARRKAARIPAHRIEEPADGTRRDLPVRHARPDRGDVDGRQDRRSQRWPAGADRHAARGLQHARTTRSWRAPSAHRP